MTIQELWAAGRIPIVSGIFFASGEVHTLIASYESGGETRISHGEVLSIDNICLNEGVLYTSIDSLFQAVFLFDSRNIKIFCGEGGYGGDGFVCATENDAVLWMAFFEYSNPFMKAEQDGGYLIVKNNCDEEWRFPIDNPQDVSVTASSL